MMHRHLFTMIVLVQLLTALVFAQPAEAAGGGSLSGSVFVDGNGNAIAEPGEAIVAGALVHIRSQANPLFELTVLSDASGYFWVNDLPYGIYDVWAVADNHSGVHLLAAEVAEVNAPVLLDVPVSDASASAAATQARAIFLPLVASN